MAGSDWAEVRRLAADLHRLQESSTPHRLTERNCVELVAMLVKRGLLDVMYTRDGKEYVTSGQLEREIRDELLAHGGRINIVDLQQTSNLDLSHVESRISEMIRHDRSLTLLHGEIIERTYMQRLCEEINDMVQEAGQVSLADLSRNFNLPINILVEHIEVALQTNSIRGHLDKGDGGFIYTEAYVNRYKARIRGMFHAITVPTAVSRIITEGNYQEKLFNSVLHQLISSGELAGNLQGRQDKAVYIPQIYILNQNKWANSFLSANGYLEYDVLSRLGIDDPREFVTQRYCGDGESSALVLLSTCCVGRAVISRVEGVMEETLVSDQWADCMPLLPSPCSRHDAELLLHHLQCSQPDLRILGSVMTTKTFLQSCCEQLKTTVVQRAQEAATRKPGRIPEQKDDENSSRKKGSGKKGGRNRGRGGESDEPLLDHFLTVDEIATELEKGFSECSREFMSDVALTIESSLKGMYVTAIKECARSVGPSISSSELRKRHSELTEKVQSLWNMLQLFEKATLHFQGDAMIQLNRYLLRTICSDLFNFLIRYFAKENGVEMPATLTVQERASIIKLLPTSTRKKLTAVNVTLGEKAVAAFLPLFEDLCAEEYCGVMLKRLDKKRERQMLFSHQQSLLQNLQSEQEPSMAFHLVVVILFQQSTNCAIHVSGKLLPQVMEFLSDCLEKEKYLKLLEFQSMLIDQLSAGKDRKYLTEDQHECMGGEPDDDIAADESEGRTQPFILEQRLKDSVGDLKQLVVKPKKMKQ